MPARDDFSIRVKNQVAARAGWVCSNPHCRQPTSGPSDSEKAVTNVGVAAHITAASPRGPRFNPNLTGVQRRSAGNAVWLCQKCAKAIDDDAARYPSGLLEEWRSEAEASAREAIERGPRSKRRQRGAILQPAARDRPLSMLIVEDDGAMSESLRNMFAQYSSHITVSLARDAGEALERIEGARPDVLLLDLLMPYGAAAAVLDASSDPDFFYAGLRLLEHIRGQEREGAPPIWIAVITARSGLGTFNQLRRILGPHGRVYQKPFDSFALEHDVVSALDVPSRVPPELLHPLGDE